MVYSFKPNGSFRIQYKPIDPDNEDVSHAISIFYISVGSLANMVQTHVKDTHDYLESHPEYYKRDIKFNIKEAHKRIDKLMDVFKRYTEEVNGFKMWLDITDEMEDKLKPDVQKAYYSLDNYLLANASGGDHNLVSHSVLAFNLATMLVIMTRDYANVLFKENPNIPSSLKVSNEYVNLASGVSKSLANLCAALVPKCKFVYDKSQAFSCRELNLSLDIIFKSLMLNEGNIQEACERALSYGGVNFSNDNDGAGLKNGLQNKGSEWNETQEGVLKAYFKNNPDTSVASMLGRTVYEVRKKAKEMGLKKSEKYLKEIRGKNLKKDKNGNH